MVWRTCCLYNKGLDPWYLILSRRYGKGLGSADICAASNDCFQRESDMINHYFSFFHDRELYNVTCKLLLTPKEAR